MKKILITLIIALFGFAVNAQTKKQVSKPIEIKNQTVEISCGECNFKLKGKSCDLAVRINDKAYFVDGKKIDDFGDAHAKHGFCNAISKANVTGEIVKGRFKAKEITLLPTEDKKD
jgi:hypothetical protein